MKKKQMKHFQIMWAIIDRKTHGRENPFFLWGPGSIGILTFDTRKQAYGKKKEMEWTNARVVKVMVHEL